MALYKILVQGQSCHGGSLDWSLPHDGQPGEWHEVQGELVKCRKGIHLTDDPAQWWKPGCTIYPVEAEGVVGSCEDDADRKVVAHRVRLLRELTQDKLSELHIWSEGEHEVHGTTAAIACGNASVVAGGNARVVAGDNTRVRAEGNVIVEAGGNASVVARNQATVISWKGQDGIKVMEQAVCIDRSGDKPVMVMADEGADNGTTR